MTDWSGATFSGLQSFWEGFVNFIPSFLIALIVFIIGWLISAALGRVVEEILKRLKLDKIFEARGWQEAIEKGGIHEKPSGFIGALIKWILIIVFLAIAVEILGLPQFSLFLQKILAWIPNLLIAVLIFIVTIVVANFAERITKTSLKKSNLGYAEMGASFVRWAIWVFGIFAILVQLGIAQELILAMFYGLVGFIVLAGGLAFGLGGKEVAQELLKNLVEKLKR